MNIHDYRNCDSCLDEFHVDELEDYNGLLLCKKCIKKIKNK